MISLPTLESRCPVGFVGHDNGRIIDESTGNGHPLLLTTRKFRWPVHYPVFQTDCFQRFHGLFPSSVVTPA